MPKSDDTGVVTYIIAEMYDAIAVEAKLVELLAPRGMAIEAAHVHADHTFPESLGLIEGKKYVFFSSADDSAYQLGTRETGVLRVQGLMIGMFRDGHNIVQCARDDRPDHFAGLAI